MPRKFEIELFSFDELSKKAKERAIKDFADDPEKTWDQDDSERLTEMFENDLEDHYGLGKFEVYWSLGYCQGDGVCFKGTVDIPKFIKTEKQEKKFQKIIWLDEQGAISVKISNRNRSCHYNSMEFDIDYPGAREGDLGPQGPREWSPRDVSPEGLDKLVEEFVEYLKDRVQEISQEMEKAGYEEIEYHRSDDYVTEILENRDYEYTKDGERWKR